MESRTWKFTQDRRQELCDDIIARTYRSRPDNEIASLKRYVRNGDIEDFLATGGDTIDSVSVYYVGANFSVTDAIYRLQYFFSDVQQAPKKYKNVVNMSLEQDDWDHDALARIRGQYASLPSGFLNADQFHENFVFHYGEQFTPISTLELDFCGSTKQYTFDNDGAWIACGLLRESLEYIFDIDPEPIFDPTRVKNLFSYMVSAMPEIPHQAFEKYRYGRNHTLSNGERSGYHLRQSVVRRAVALLNGVLNKSQKRKGINELNVFDTEELARFKNAFESVDFPAPYYELADFIKKHGDAYSKASIDLEG